MTRCLIEMPDEVFLRMERLRKLAGLRDVPEMLGRAFSLYEWFLITEMNEGSVKVQELGRLTTLKVMP